MVLYYFCWQSVNESLPSALRDPLRAYHGSSQAAQYKGQTFDYMTGITLRSPEIWEKSTEAVKLSFCSSPHLLLSSERICLLGLQKIETDKLCVYCKPGHIFYKKEVCIPIMEQRGALLLFLLFLLMLLEWNTSFFSETAQLILLKFEPQLWFQKVGKQNFSHPHDLKDKGLLGQRSQGLF